MNEDFKWTDELVAEFAEYYRKKQGVDYTTWGKCILDCFKKEKANQPLFTTEDGKDVYEGDDEYDVSLDTWEITKTKATVVANGRWFEAYKPFSTEQAAKEYVVLHKKELSLLDVHEVLLAKLMSSWEHDIAIEYYRKLKLLVEKKINDNTL